MGDDKTKAKAGKGRMGQRELRERLASAIASQRQGQLEEAEQVYLAVLAADQDNADALHYLGAHAPSSRASVRSAIDWCGARSSSAPTTSTPLNNLGNMYQQLNGPEEAARRTGKRSSVRPDHPPTPRKTSASCCASSSATKKRSACTSARSENDPGNVQNYYALPQAYKEMGRPEEAVETLKKALAIKPDGDGFRRLGQLLYALHRVEEAAAKLRSLAARRARQPDRQAHAGGLHRARTSRYGPATRS